MTHATRRGLVLISLGVMLIAGVPAVLPQAEAGGFGKALIGRALQGGTKRAATQTAKPAMGNVLKRDAARDAATAAKPLPAPRTVHRYTTAEQAAREAKHGLSPGTHMTPNAVSGRPLTSQHAQGRYGLPTSPQVRETIELPKGYPVRHNKALGGEPGRGELTSPQHLPPGAIRGIVPLP